MVLAMHYVYFNFNYYFRIMTVGGMIIKTTIFSCIQPLF